MSSCCGFLTRQNWRYTAFKRPHFLLIFLGSVLVIYYIFSGDDVSPHKLVNFKILRYYPIKKTDLTCKRPPMALKDPGILKLLKDENMEPLDCTTKFPLLFESKMDPYPRLVPIVGANTKMKTCCYRQLLLERGKDYKFSDTCWQVSLEEQTQIPLEHEYVSIECTEEERGNATIMDMHIFPHVPHQGKAGEGKFNILILGVDTMSRLNFERTMPLTYKYALETLKAVDMQGQNKIADNTYPNLGPLLTNQFVSDDYETSCVSSENCTFIWKDPLMRDYLSSFVEDEVTMSLEHHFNFGPRETDYNFYRFLDVMSKYLGHEMRIASKMCLGPRHAPSKMTDYVKKLAFVMKASGNNYFQFVMTAAITHDYLNGGRVIDEDWKNMLQFLNEGGFLSNTVLFLMSDHGARIGAARGDDQGQLEDRTSFLFIVLPKVFKEKYSQAYQNLQSNSHGLTTFWDLHQTMRHILQPEILVKERLSELVSTSPNGQSLFLPIPLNRTCKDAGVPWIYCTCNYYLEPMPSNDSLAIHVTMQALQEFNDILKPHPLCEQLQLGKIYQANRLTFTDQNRKGANGEALWQPQAYFVLFDTIPNWTTFDALVVQEVEGGPWIPRNVGRSTWYWLDGKTKCLGEYRQELRLAMVYCHCKEPLNDNTL